jgi:hypothetical protein
MISGRSATTGERPGVSGAQSDPHLLADLVRTNSHQLREYLTAALEAFDDLDAPDVLERLGKAPDPARTGGPPSMGMSGAGELDSAGPWTAADAPIGTAVGNRRLIVTHPVAQVPLPGG